MGRSPCCDNGLKKGPWTPEEDQKLIDCIKTHGTGNWKALPKRAGLNRCGKSCRLRWANYLRPDIKRGKFSEEEDTIIINLHADYGNKWSRIASHLPGRTDNEIKNYWNTHMRKKLLKMGIDPVTHKPRNDISHLMNLSQLLCAAQLGNLTNPYERMLKLQADAAQAAQVQLIQNLLQVINTTTLPTTTTQAAQFQLIQKILQDINTAEIPRTSFQNNTEPTGQLQSRNNYTFEELPGSMSVSHHKDMNAPARQILSSGLLRQGGNDSQSNTNSGPCYECGVGKEVYNPDEISCPQMAKSVVQPNCSAESSLSPSFNPCENFLEDNSSDSYWKNILDFTSLLSPVSGSNTILQNINL